MSMSFLPKEGFCQVSDVCLHVHFSDQPCSQLGRQELNTAPPLPDHYCTDSGSKWHDEMSPRQDAAILSGIYQIQVYAVEGMEMCWQSLFISMVPTFLIVYRYELAETHYIHTCTTWHQFQHTSKYIKLYFHTALNLSAIIKYTVSRHLQWLTHYAV